MAAAGKMTVHVVIDEHRTFEAYECDNCAALIPVHNRAKHDRFCRRLEQHLADVLNNRHVSAVINGHDLMLTIRDADKRRRGTR